MLFARAYTVVVLSLHWLAVSAQSEGNRTVFPALYKAHSDKTPRFLGLTRGSSSNSIRPAQLLKAGNVTALASSDTLAQGRAAAAQEEGVCAPGSPCTNGACCANTGWCGYGPDFCGDDVCLSNCDAEAECGKYSKGGSVSCPLNVCCSEWGFCGSTEEFCGDECQDEFGTCGEPNRPFCSGTSAEMRRIGYYESWVTERKCDASEPDDLILTGLTHLNFAFAFFDPSTFQIAPMDATSANWYTKTTSLKEKKPGLKVWISVGGWSFNDDNNIPSTRTAFSDMASSSSNRQAFISGLIKFMRTNSFDGADLDWEYPGADDRGGIPEDTDNFVTLVKEMKAAFNGEFGLSVTIPASYWYLKWFDVKAMEPHVDWLNVMTYDIHGVWDGENKFTGPYVRPHTNLTEIEEGLDLLWRSNVSPSKVVLGLAYYGRSFTLKDPDCDKPGCQFQQGGNPGECSDARGILTNAEINRVIEDNGLTPTFDAKAAVNWITWDKDQWFANRYCLGGTMVWALDQDNEKGTSAENSLDNNRFDVDIPLLQYSRAEEESDLYNQCYTSFCGAGCKEGFRSASLMNGQIGGVPFDTRCPTGHLGRTSYQYLCCPLNMYARCQWDGFHGEGMACKTGCGEDYHELARNTNYKLIFPDRTVIENTCNGGSMSYCCNFGGVMGPKTNPLSDISLIDSTWDPLSHKDLQKRDMLDNLISSEIIALSGGQRLDPNKYGGMTLDELLGDDYSLLRPGVPGTGPVQGFNNKYNAVAGGSGGNGKTSAAPTSVTKGTSGHKTNAQGQRLMGSYAQVTYATSETSCSVTYTCKYGVGFDEHSSYRAWGRVTGHYSGKAQTRYHCEGDEFPMAGLVEAAKPNVQGVRQVDGIQNGQQGRDYLDWLLATWMPCSALLGRPPLITWSIDMSAVPNNDARRTAASFLQKYGFDRQDPSGRCFPRVATGGGGTTTIADHGFRVLEWDDILTNPINWPRQAYSGAPDLNALPTSVNSVGFLGRRDLGLELDGGFSAMFDEGEEGEEGEDGVDVQYLEDEEWDELMFAYQLSQAEDEEEYNQMLRDYDMWRHYRDTAPPPEPTSVWFNGTVYHRGEETPKDKDGVAPATPGPGVVTSQPQPTG
ncbi:hypothetical protein FE257_007036 [Aspergillus nanangensis]|uniref:chitinase n=1 Tax=Aspergillus nanangensis TaxID=2582783 RepID=A0AAD4CND5_ASPNN|nr:hypothetical protein FE257_007036 [Aspergillus nanangensis]